MTRYRNAGMKATIVLACTFCVVPAALPAASPELIALLNQYRANPTTCGGQRMPAVDTLAHHPALSAVRIGSGTLLAYALEQQGYAAEHVEAMFVTGPHDARSALDALVRAYCPALRAERFQAVGVSRSGNAWQLVMAQPAPPRAQPVPLPPLAQAGPAIAAAVNRARAVSRMCGSTSFAAAPPVSLSQALVKVASAHSSDMARHAYFSHTGKDGSTVGQRAAAAGYTWATIGENIAYGQHSVDEVMSGWLASPGHCANIMGPRFTEVGIGYAAGTTNGRTYWTQVLAAPRR